MRRFAFGVLLGALTLIATGCQNSILPTAENSPPKPRSGFRDSGSYGEAAGFSAASRSVEANLGYR